MISPYEDLTLTNENVLSTHDDVTTPHKDVTTPDEDLTLTPEDLLSTYFCSKERNFPTNKKTGDENKAVYRFPCSIYQPKKRSITLDPNDDSR